MHTHSSLVVILPAILYDFSAMQPLPTRLIIDTSSEQTILGIACGQDLLASFISPHANRLSQTLMPQLQSLLQQADLTLHEIDEIAVGIGPGSYTGTRVGVAVAKSLHFALKRPRLTGFCSLLAFIPPSLQKFACVMPSKTGDFYLLKGIRSSHHLTCSQSELVDRASLTLALNDISHLIGKPFEEMRALLPEFAACWMPPHPSLEPIIEYLSSLPPTEEPSSVELIYLHKP
jgi:tRNA threonylcarbamoyl adenosine modification protein YeaZ